MNGLVKKRSLVGLLALLKYGVSQNLEVEKGDSDAADTVDHLLDILPPFGSDDLKQLIGLLNCTQESTDCSSDIKFSANSRKFQQIRQDYPSFDRFSIYSQSLIGH